MEDRRLYERRPVGFHAQVTAHAKPDLSISVEVRDISKSGISAFMPLQLETGTILQLQIADSTITGVVVHSQEWPPMSRSTFAREKIWSDWNPEAEVLQASSYLTGIEVVEISIGTTDLSQLLKATFDEPLRTGYMVLGPVL